MGLFNPDLFNGPELFNTGEVDTPVIGPTRRRYEHVETRIEQEDDEIILVLVQLRLLAP